MANMRAIRTRIKSVENTRQITRSMKMVAASKLRKTQNSMTNMRPFARQCGEMLKALASGCTDEPFFGVGRERKKVCYVLIPGNRGLCGVYNSSLLRHLTGLMAQDGRESFTVVCGRWGRELISAAGVNVRKSFTEISDTPDAAAARELSEYLKELYLSGEADEIVLVYQSFRSVLAQTPTAKRLLPVEPEAGEKAPDRDVIFEPDRQSLLKTLVQLYIDNTVYSALLEARTGEHAARMTAMTAASDNTDELIAELNLELNHARQAAITTEISEISGGAAALNKE